MRDVTGHDYVKRQSWKEWVSQRRRQWSSTSYVRTSTILALSLNRPSFKVASVDRVPKLGKKTLCFCVFIQTWNLTTIHSSLRIYSKECVIPLATVPCSFMWEGGAHHPCFKLEKFKRNLFYYQVVALFIRNGQYRQQYRKCSSKGTIIHAT